MANKTHLFTSESVTEGHPDKVSDQISDAVLDAVLKQDPKSRVACETLVNTGLVVLAGEITTRAKVEFAEVARKTIREIGYTNPDYRFDADGCSVMSALDRQSPDIAMGVDTDGAGDQGLMFGYACRETRQLMPLPIMAAHQLTKGLADLRKSDELPWLRPDGKSQVTVEYSQEGKPLRIDAVVVSTQHDEEVSQREIHRELKKRLIEPILGSKVDRRTKFHINPTGRFVIGGPHGDCGLTGRKIIVDTYGGVGRHGGGAFSGKDATKVDRSACYMARYVAKNLVAARLADKVEVQLAYAIGVAEPVSIHVDSFGTSAHSDRLLEDLVKDNFKLTPKAIISHLKLRRPIFRKTAAYGHFGRGGFSWEKTDKAKALAKAAG